MQNVFEQKTTDLLHAIYDIILFTGQISYDQSVRLVDLGKFLGSWVVLSRLFSTYYLSSLLLCIYLSVLSVLSVKLNQNTDTTTYHPHCLAFLTCLTCKKTKNVLLHTCENISSLFSLELDNSFR